MRVFLLDSNQVRFRAAGRQPLFVEAPGLDKKRARSVQVLHTEGSNKMQLVLTERTAGSHSFPLNGLVKISSNDPRGVWLGKHRYRGELRVYFVENQLRVINHIDLEKYLISVVGSEMPKSWPMAALKAQAVAARTYALQKIRKSSFFDVAANETSQVYLGIEAETPTTTEAVRRTRSLVMTHKGRIINAVFHSSSGGMTENSGSLWRNQLPYLVSVKDDDQHSPKHHWDLIIHHYDLKKIFPETNGVLDIELVSLSKTGRVLKAIIHGPLASISLSGKELRNRLKLKSSLVRFKFIPIELIKRKKYNSYFYSFLDSKNFRRESPSPDMRSSRGFWRDWSKGGESIVDIDIPEFSEPPAMSLPGLKQLPAIEPSIASSPVSTLSSPVSVSGKSLALLARGFGAGHGVGMSQWGAHGMASKGIGFRKILTHYYTGVAIGSYK